MYLILATIVAITVYRVAVVTLNVLSVPRPHTDSGECD